MSFNINDCKIKKIYCGDKALDTNEYSRNGTKRECLKKGFGLAQWKGKNLHKNSLQNIGYIGPVHEQNFRDHNIRTTRGLISRFKELSVRGKERLLKSICQKSDGNIDQKAFNSVVLYLYQNGILNLPKCTPLSEN